LKFIDYDVVMTFILNNNNNNKNKSVLRNISSPRTRAQFKRYLTV